MTTPSVDDLVTDVAGAMTAGEPSARFAASVIARVSAAQRSPRRRVGPWAVSVTALLAIGVVITWTPPATRTPTAGPVVSMAPGPGLATPAPASQAAPGTFVARADVRSLREAAMLVEWRARSVPELDALAPLAIDGIQPEDLSMTQLSVAPLAVMPLAIAPLGDEGGR
jgi:hypothetical protein